MSKSSKLMVNSEDLNSLPDNTELSPITDQLDYPPGSTVNITQTGLAIGASAPFQVADPVSDPGDDSYADVYKPFAVTDRGRSDLELATQRPRTNHYSAPRDRAQTVSIA